SPHEFGVIFVHLTPERFYVHLAAVTGADAHDGVPSISFAMSRPTAQRSEAPVICTSRICLVRADSQATPTFRKWGVVPRRSPSVSPSSNSTETELPIHRSANARRF